MRTCPRCLQTFGDDVEHCPQDGSTLRVGSDPLVGRILGGRYRLLARIGAGGMSSVYLARHVVIDRRIAIKTLRRDLASDPIQRDRFLREARAVNRINHENIVEITDFGESEDGLVYLAMELVDGVSLFKAMATSPFATDRALHIAAQVAGALVRAHQMGVVHRDLKPENVLLTERDGDGDFVKVLDFGIAKIFDAPSLTGSQQIFGTPGYIAPEYIQSTQIDGRSDLYSLGVILYEMVTGALPFDYEYPGDLLVKHVTEPPIPPRTRLPEVHADLDAFILRCLRKDPEERFRDATQFLSELERLRVRMAPEPRARRQGARHGGSGDSSRPTIKVGRFFSMVPDEPRVDGSPSPILAAASPDPSEPVEVSRWRGRIDAARRALDGAGAGSDPDVIRSLAYVERALAHIEEVAVEWQRHRPHGEGERSMTAALRDGQMTRLEPLVDGVESRVAWLERRAGETHANRADTPASG
jgi:serine/threonine protein kinase